MSTKRVLLTAGYDRAVHVVALAELLRRQGHSVVGVVVVTPFSWKRLQVLSRQRGRGFLVSALRRLVGATRPKAKPNSLDVFLNKHAIRERSISGWARKNGATVLTVSSLNNPSAVHHVADVSPDVVIYGGGGILGKSFLRAARGRVLNAHSGPLPEIRGMNALEWSLLLGVAPCVTIHVIDRGIDTGGIVEQIPVFVSPGETIEELRSQCTVLGVEGLVRAVGRQNDRFPDPRREAASNRQCFVMAPILRELLEFRLSQGRYLRTEVTTGSHETS